MTTAFDPGAQATVANEAGGLQSALPGAFYMLPGRAIKRLRTTYIPRAYTQHGHFEMAMDSLAHLLQDDESLDYLGVAFLHLAFAVDMEIVDTDEHEVALGSDDCFPYGALLRIAQVLGDGAAKYPRGNWRLIEYWSQIDHALQHLIAYGMGDESDDHLGHAACRMAMAVEVEDRAYRFTHKPEPKRIEPTLAIDAGIAVEDVERFIAEADHEFAAACIRRAIKTGDRTFLSLLAADEWKAFTGDLLIQEFAARDEPVTALHLVDPCYIADTGYHDFGAGAYIEFDDD